MKNIVFIYLLVLLALVSCVTVDAGILSKPVCTIYTPSSILANKEQYQPLVVNNRKRYGTCTGAVWFHDHYLAVLNLLGRKIITYQFNPIDLTFKIIQEIDHRDDATLYNAENLVVSPDGTLLAVCTDDPNAGVRLYTIDLTTHLIIPKIVGNITSYGLTHNVRFTTDGRFLAMVGWDMQLSVCVYKVIRNNNNVNLERVYQKANDTKIMRPKGINFTKDNRFVVICYSVNLGSKLVKNRSAIMIYRFNAADGSLGELVSNIENSSRVECFEDIAFINNDRTIIVTNQVQDVVMMFPFDPVSGLIHNNFTLLQNPDANLSFPHGIGVSPDGRYVAITNYGDDKCNVYQVIE